MPLSRDVEQISEAKLSQCTSVCLITVLVSVPSLPCIFSIHRTILFKKEIQKIIKFCYKCGKFRCEILINIIVNMSV